MSCDVSPGPYEVQIIHVKKVIKSVAGCRSQLLQSIQLIYPSNSVEMSRVAGNPSCSA